MPQPLILLLLILLGCQSSPPQPEHFSQTFMTIDFHLSVGDRLNFDQKKKIQEIIESTFAEIDAIFNKWNSQSEISQINRLPAHIPLPLSPQLYQFLERLDILVALSEGCFDPTIEPLQQLWKESLEKGKYPDKQAIAEFIPAIGWDKIHLSDGSFTKEDGRTQLDLGGVAKGLCVDRLTDRLTTAGFHNLFIEWGGEMRTTGRHPSGRPWHIYISHYENSHPSHAIAHLDLADQALATSGDYHQFWKIQTDQGEEKTYCHIFNPHTLAPLEVKKGSMASCSLLASDCVTADALAKVPMFFESPQEVEQWISKVKKLNPEIHFWLYYRD